RLFLFDRVEQQASGRKHGDQRGEQAHELHSEPPMVTPADDAPTNGAIIMLEAGDDFAGRVQYKKAVTPTPTMAAPTRAAVATPPGMGGAPRSFLSFMYTAPVIPAPIAKAEVAPPAM